MSELSPQPDRFGCLSVATVLWMGLMLALAIVVAIVMGDDFGSSLRQWLNGNQNQAPNGPGDVADPNADVIPPISNRWYDSGSASTTIGGGPFALNAPIQIDPYASYTQDGLSWISFIDNTNPGAGEILIALGEPENTVTVAQGTKTIIGTDAECKFDIDVTASGVSGSVDCPKADILNSSDQPSGETAAIHLQFSSASHPMENDDGTDDGDPGDGGDVETPAGDGG